MAVEQFTFQATDASGKVTSGKVDAPSKDAVVAQLRARGLMPLDVEPVSKTGLNTEIRIPGLEKPVKTDVLAVFAKQMAAAGGGAIINFGSMNTYRPLTRVAAYAMSKAAIANWTQFLAQYLAPAKIRVNAIAPGFFVNDRSRKILCTPDGGLTARGEQVMAHSCIKRFGEPEELLGCVNWLLDDSAASFVTGITVPVDGGFHASSGV